MKTNKFCAGPGRLTTFAVLAMFLALAGCGGNEQAAAIPGQKWLDQDVQIESRPAPPRPGMNEILVMVTGAHGRPTYDLVVSLRTDDHDEWKQAIEDGQIGVYRRAVEVEPGARSVLQVQIRQRLAPEAGASVLRFPLNPVQ